MTADELKRAAAARALAFVEPGMRLGLGTGSTAKHFVDLLGARVAAGLDVIGVPTSEATRVQAEALGIKLTTLDDIAELDLTIDGADEVDPALDLIKGGGGAHLREKIVASASHRLVIIVDETKRVPQLGRFPLPVEVVPFGLAATTRAVEKACAAAGAQGRLVQRMTPQGHAFVTDGGHLILDAHLGAIPDAPRLADRLAAVPGVVEHGLFIGLASAVVLAGSSGIEVVTRPSS